MIYIKRKKINRILKNNLIRYEKQKLGKNRNQKKEDARMYYEEKKKSKERLMLYCFMVIIIALLLVLILKMEAKNEMTTVTGYSAEKVNLEEQFINSTQTTENPTIINKIQNSVNAIVGISKLKQSGSSIFVGQAEQKLGLGSGVVITDNGYILTNQHVAGNKYSSCYVTLEDGKIYDGSVVWSDSNIDLAIVKINKANLEYLELGDSDTIGLAEDVYAIGNPLGMDFQKTVTKGIISSLNRTIKIEGEKENVYMEDLIQTDATINEGNSGGALINQQGQLIGINSVKISDAEGIGFAVPINIVKPIINQLINEGKFDEAWLGIYGYDKEAIKFLDSNIEIESGIYVAQVALDGPLASLDIKEGDIITKVDNTEISKMNDLKKYIYEKNPEDSIQLFVQRNGKESIVEVKLLAKP